jgi:hypothetical protein
MGRNSSLAQLVCTVCGDTYEVPVSLAHRYAACSRECSTVRRERVDNKLSITCVICGKAMRLFPSRIRAGGNTCSNPCRWVHLNNQPRVPMPVSDRTRHVTLKGYVRLAIYHGRQVMEHRLVMEEVIGRPLTRVERVHHLNGDRTDNRSENLVLCATQAEHIQTWHQNLVHNLPGR